MTYELAKKLKDSGLTTKPYSENESAWLCSEMINGKCKRKAEEGKHFNSCQGVPNYSLSELISACGEEYFSMEECSGNEGINNSDEKWYAQKRDVKIKTFGSTPEEAVANLLLCLLNDKVKENDKCEEKNKSNL